MDDQNIAGNLYPESELPELQKSAGSVSGTSKVKLKHIDREQVIFQSVAADDLIDLDHEVRAIWELLGTVNLSDYIDEIKTKEGEAGSAAFNPRMLLCLCIYAIGKGISSSREISRLCETDPVFKWITGIQSVNHHTISDFRVCHAKALKDLFVSILSVLSKDGLVTMERVTQDGTKIKANASAGSFRREARIEEHMKKAEQQWQEMENQGDEEVSLKKKKAQERAVKEKKARLEHAKTELEKIREIKKSVEEKKEARVSFTDPDARIMKDANGGFAPNYNVQVTTDAKAGIIVNVTATQSGNDQRELMPAMAAAEKNTGIKPEQVVADGGYTNRQNILETAENQIDLIGSFRDDVGKKDSHLISRGVSEGFFPGKFDYNEETNTMICPASKILKLESIEKKMGKTNFRYSAKESDCKNCPFKNKCCPEAIKRNVYRVEESEPVKEYKKKMETPEAKAIYKTRGQIAEFPHAWIKDKMRLRQFRCRGIEKVQQESEWAAMVYNIKQWIRLIWKPSKVEAMI